ncbi:TPA: hypothetical protein ACH7T5_004779 [Escherichia coli]
MLPDELEKRLDGIEDASKKGYPVRNLYKIACEPGLWLQAYVNIRANAGALTQGVSTDTIDGFLDWPPESPDNQYHLNK